MSVTDFHPTSQQITSNDARLDISNQAPHTDFQITNRLHEQHEKTLWTSDNCFNCLRTAWCWPTSSQHKLICGWRPQLLKPPWVVNSCSWSRRLSVFTPHWTIIL